MKGYGIFVGVNETDPVSYNNEKNPLPSARLDAEKMYELAEATGLYEINREKHLLYGEKAKWSVVKDLLDKLWRENNDDESYLLFTFSGHGYDRANPLEDDKCHRSQFLCFNDGMVLEEELREELEKFSKKFKIVIVLDACFSAGIGRRKLFKRLPSDDVFESNSEYADRLNRYKHKHTDKIKADVCYFSAVAKDKKGLTGVNNGNSYYTSFLLFAWQNGLFEGNYYAFQQVLERGLQTYYKPDMTTVINDFSGYFSYHVPFLYNKISKPLNANYMSWNFNINEPGGDKKVTVELTPPDNLKNFDYLGAFICDSGQCDRLSVEEYLTDLYGSDRPEFIMIVDVVEVTSGPETIIIDENKSSLYSIDPNDSPGNGAVVVYNYTRQIPLDAKRTKGKVSNQIGESGQIFLTEEENHIARN